METSSLQELSKRIGLTKKSIIKLLEDKQFNVNIATITKNGNLYGVDVAAFIRELKNPYFKQKYGYVRSTELYEVIKSKYSGLNLSFDALVAKLSGLSETEQIPLTLNVSLKTGGAVYKLYKLEEALRYLNSYLAERTPGMKAEVAQKRETTTVKKSTEKSILDRLDALEKENKALKEILNVEKVYVNKHPILILKQVVAKLENGEIPESRPSDISFALSAKQMLNSNVEPTEAQMVVFRKIAATRYNNESN